ncbi:alpha/beta fold hydrolase [Hymenobacter properus]|uniref:Alpha/beta hydrolase n=1 Tax=Hymenobacter properus TaxID=2791026 RepID=A0A931BD05_9BACT|nr:alpha/beta hydrolase [Hymenobacter properus]MBF9141549.1 alpha/beta hydrolase [Hymenobacter properus]MBR7720358.1 alpha/beta hydrolase [Microvirga sp. SRT04]
MSHTIIALHCWASSGREYDLLRQLLPAPAALLAPDLPGFGGQAVPAGYDYSVRAYADWIAAFIAQHHVADFTLIGHSMSGKMALALAARQPAGLRRLVLLSPSPPAGEPMTDEDRAASVAAHGKLEEAEKTFRKITRRPIAPEIRARVIADNLRTTQAAWTHWLLEGAREDITALMPRVQVPCHLLVGEGDTAITPESQRHLTLPLLPAGTPFRVVPGAGHLLPLEAPDEVMEAVRR